MSVEAHIEQLRRRHSELDARLHELNLSPSATDGERNSLKRDKLRVKDEIERLTH